MNEEISKYNQLIRTTEENILELQRKLKLYKIEKQNLENKLNLAKSFNNNVIEQYEGNNFPWSTQIQSTLQSSFKLESFRLNQLTAINVLLSGKDLLLVMPTGGGKSICYQLPALISNGMTLVVSPLLSLIEDQLHILANLNIVARSINSQTPKEERNAILDYMRKGVGPPIKLLYVTPEWLNKSKTFKSCLQKCHSLGKIDRIAIDEVHCCSKWGHDFRPDYQFLSLLKDMLEVPIIGLTATATVEVLLDVQKMLDINGCLVLRSSLNRPNLYYSVEAKPVNDNNAVDLLANLLQKRFENKSGIVYVLTIKDAETLSDALRSRGIKVRPYHAQLENTVRSEIHKKWLANHYQAVVATVAFGMGIDKPNVRFVVHYTVPRSIESLYQESGRAGRDGQRAECLLFYRLGDFLKAYSMTNSKTEEEKLMAILDYCINSQLCRRKQITDHFEEEFEECMCQRMCDNCSNSMQVQEYDATSAVRFIADTIASFLQKETNVTLLKLVDAWGKTTERNLKKDYVHAELIVAHLLKRHVLRIHKSYTAYQTYCYIQMNPNYSLKKSDEKIVIPVCRLDKRRLEGVKGEGLCKKPKGD